MRVYTGGLKFNPVTLALAGGLLMQAPAMAEHVDPVLVPGNPTCADIGSNADFGIKPFGGGMPPPDATVDLTGSGLGGGVFSLTYNNSNSSCFDWSTTGAGIDALIVKGGSDANVYYYDPAESSDTNVCSPNNSSGNPAAVSHIEICYSYHVAVSKTAETDYTRTWEWDIDKSVDPAQWSLYDGDDATSAYTVAVDRTGFVDSDHSVAGAITVSNPLGGLPINILGIADELDTGESLPVDCAGADGATLAPGAEIICSYGGTAAADTSLNTATVDFEKVAVPAGSLAEEGELGSASGTAAVSYGAPGTEIDASVTITDTVAGELGTVSDDETFSYERTFTCDAGQSQGGDQTVVYPNTASIIETGASDDASVSVSCFAISVSKTAAGDFTRTHTWELEKSVIFPEVDLFLGDEATVQWTISATETITDSDFGVTGLITVMNPAPIEASISAIADLLSDGTDASGSISCDFGATLPSGGTGHCTYGTAVADASERDNTATATLANFSYAPDGSATAIGSTDYSATVPVVWNDPNIVGDDSIVVDDSNGMSFSFETSGSQSYEESYTCEDLQLNAGEATIVVNTASSTSVSASAIADLDVACYDLDVEKSAAGSYDVEYDWTIDKTVDPAQWDLFEGDSSESTYQISVTKDDGTAVNIAVTGVISITNNHPNRAADLAGIVDQLSDGTVAVHDCPSTVAAGQTVTCGYLATPGGLAGGVNNVTVTQNNHEMHYSGAVMPGGTTVYTASADYGFGTPASAINDTITVQDTDWNGNVESFSFSDSGSSPTYTRQFECGAGSAGEPGTDYVNTAVIVELGDSDSETVRVNCHDLTVAKTADTDFERNYDWTVDKSADQTELLLADGQTFQVNYTVVASVEGFTDSNHGVTGLIVITNNHPSSAAPLAGVIDMVSGGFGMTVSCPASSVPAGGSMNCSYAGSLPNGSDRLNTATASLQNRFFGADSTSNTGTTDYSGSASVSFGAPGAEFDDCVTVEDDLFGGTLGTACVGGNGSFSYTIDVTADGASACEFFVDNTAIITENTTGEGDADVWSVYVTVADCGFGCTLTPGYWKTHSSYGPAPYDETWAQIGEDTPFFPEAYVDEEDGVPYSWYSVMWEKVRGNVYFILARAYVAAELNLLNGASADDSVLDALDAAEAIFQANSHEDIGALKKKPQDRALRDEIIMLAGLLDAYNNGIGGYGPAHCSEDSNSVDD